MLWEKIRHKDFETTLNELDAGGGAVAYRMPLVSLCGDQNALARWSNKLTSIGVRQ